MRMRNVRIASCGQLSGLAAMLKSNFSFAGEVFFVSVDVDHRRLWISYHK